MGRNDILTSLPCTVREPDIFSVHNFLKQLKLIPHVCDWCVVQTACTSLAFSFSLDYHIFHLLLLFILTVMDPHQCSYQPKHYC